MCAVVSYPMGEGRQTSQQRPRTRESALDLVRRAGCEYLITLISVTFYTQSNLNFPLSQTFLVASYFCPDKRSDNGNGRPENGTTV